MSIARRQSALQPIMNAIGHGNTQVHLYMFCMYLNYAQKKGAVTYIS